jgi:hypothetical protein
MKSIAAVAHSQRSPFVVEEVELPDLQHTPIRRNQSGCGGPAQRKRNQANPRSQRRVRMP